MSVSLSPSSVCSPVSVPAVAARYDRQMRLWGVKAQEKIMVTRVQLKLPYRALVRGLGHNDDAPLVICTTNCGFAAEIGKTLVLAGVKSMKIFMRKAESLNDDSFSFEDANSCFFMRLPRAREQSDPSLACEPNLPLKVSSSLSRAEALCEGLAPLNSLVSVTAVSATQNSDVDISIVEVDLAELVFRRREELAKDDFSALSQNAFSGELQNVWVVTCLGRFALGIGISLSSIAEADSLGELALLHLLRRGEIPKKHEKMTEKKQSGSFWDQTRPVRVLALITALLLEYFRIITSGKPVPANSQLHAAMHLYAHLVVSSWASGDGSAASQPMLEVEEMESAHKLLFAIIANFGNRRCDSESPLAGPVDTSVAGATVGRGILDHLGGSETSKQIIFSMETSGERIECYVSKE